MSFFVLTYVITRLPENSVPKWLRSLLVWRVSPGYYVIALLLPATKVANATYASPFLPVWSVGAKEMWQQPAMSDFFVVTATGESR
ncbi:MAG: hypothetical protein HIU81_13400 [Acidobacteria bacterium]|nr:hypothetical protein [Acidobacteriota bacterium]